MKELLKRTLTGAVFVILMITMIWWNIWSLSVLLLFILVAGMNEFFKLTLLQPRQKIIFWPILSGTVVLLVVLFSRVERFPGIFILYASLLAVVSNLIILKFVSADFRRVIKPVFISFTYILLPVCLTYYLADYQKPVYNAWFLLLLFVLIWTYDSFAYLTGVLLGKHKILPSVSPKKSWEGLFGGLIFTLLAAFLISLNFPDLLFYHWAGISVIVVIAGTTGDFYESFLKRKAGVKDSGNLLPGHGGILDRFDSFLFISPVVYLYLCLIK